MTEPTGTSATTEAAEVLEPAAPTLVQKIAAEIIGTFVLVLFGCGSVVYAASVGEFDILGIAMAFGLAVMVMIFAFGRVSGGHFNPAVSFAAALGGRIAWREAGVYAVAQLVGAILGAAVLFTLLHGFDGFDATDNMGQNSFGDGGYAWWAALLLELVLTAIFVLVILAVTDGRNEHPGLAPLAIGFTLTAVHLVGIPATGTSVNPVRSIGPALFAGTDALADLWLFILGPMLGAALAGLVYPVLFGRDNDPVPGSGFTFPQRSARSSAPGTSQDQYQQQWNQNQNQQQTWNQGASGTAGQQWGPEPIIQDGWQWDPQSQQWIPAQQQPPAPQQSPQPGQDQQGQPGQGQQGQQGQWPDDGETQIRH